MAEGSPKVLVIDDEPAIARVITRVLRDYDVTAVVNAASARAELDAGVDYRVVLCDVMMPGESGIDLHAAIKARTPGVADRFVFITGGVLSAAQESYLHNAGVACLAKPFTPDDLRALVRRRLSQG